VVGLVATKGFRDELEIRRESRPAVYDFSWQRTPPIIPRRRRLEVTERMGADGKVVTPLDLDEVARVLSELGRQGVEALAICLINSYANPEHERAVKTLALELLPSVAVCASYEVLPQVREYERASTTAVNAYLLPVVRHYLDRLDDRFRRSTAMFRIMQSNGGVMTVDHAKDSPVRMVESGPAAGVLAAAALAHEIGIERAVAFDMGGTTVKTCLIEGAEPVERTDYEVGGEGHLSTRYSHGFGYAISVPSFDIVEAGAGGGSIARFEDHALRVGPQSAGAEPGPAAYGRGGTEPTVTDANVVLGFINPNQIAGGTVGIDRDGAAAAIDRVLGPHLQRGTREMAYGIFQVANAAMMRSIRAVTSERGRDPRECTMIAYGGSGPVHAAALAELVGMRTVYVPPVPGLFSAVGLLLADLRYDYAASWAASLTDADLGERLATGYEALVGQARDQAVAEGIDATMLSFDRLIDLRYAGQSTETTMAVPSQLDPAAAGRLLAESFHIEHERRFGYRRDTEAITVMALRIQAWARTRSTSLRDIGRGLPRQDIMAVGATLSRPVYFGPEHGELDTSLVPRDGLASAPVTGPAIIEEVSTTVVVPPRWTASLDGLGNVVLHYA
jgi:N-methylhydantoinase A